MAARETKYIDAQGNTQTGYVIDNQTYKDAEGTQRVDTGSIVTADSGLNYILTDAGGMLYSDYLKQQEEAKKNEQKDLINQMLATAQEQQKLYNEDNIQQLESQLPKINATYDEAMNQAYQGYRSAEKSLANQLASSGLYNSGYADTAKVNQATAYGNQRNATERERAEAITGVNDKIASQNIQNNAALLGIQNDYNQLLLDQSNLDRDYNLQQEQFEYTKSQDAWEKEQYLDDKQWSRDWDTEERDYERAQADEQKLLEKAVAAAEYGGDYSLLAEYLGGIDLSLAEQYWKANMQALIREANLSGYESTSKSGSKSAKDKLDATTRREIELEAESLIKIYSTKSGTEKGLLNYIGGESAKRMYTNKYGSAGYEYLQELTAEGYGAYNSQSPTLSYDDVAPAVEDMLYTEDEETGQKIRISGADEDAVKYIAGLDGLSNQDIERLVARYGLIEAWNEVDEAEDKAEQKVKIDLSDGVSAEEAAELKRRGLLSDAEEAELKKRGLL